MIHLIPSAKLMEETGDFIKKQGLCYSKNLTDNRIVAALEKLPYHADGIKVDICITSGNGEGYELWIRPESIRIEGETEIGIFYAIQTLRQIWEHEEIPCMHVKDEPDFQYRGFYHDVTRGKVPTVTTIKKLIDTMAYYKLNSLQLYVEHTFEFEECRAINEKTGYFTKEELKEIEDYCHQNFIEFIPSISTFGHMYEILQQQEYRHLRVLKDFPEMQNTWRARMEHHTIDPLHPESIKLVESLIHQYEPLFESNFFNICCDETFDLKKYEEDGHDVGRLYVDFVKKIIDVLGQKDKTVMMWADILLQHPEVIDELPEDTIFLHWDYSAYPSEENIQKLASLNRKQIVCPSTWTWNRFCEDIGISEKNISSMAEFGYKYGAIGLLNTNWGDWGNICSLEMAMYGLVLGAEKSWSANAHIDDKFFDAVNHLLYGTKQGMCALRKLHHLHKNVSWPTFCENYFAYHNDENEKMVPIDKKMIEEVQKDYIEFREVFSQQSWKHDDYRKEMLLSAEGICILAELNGKMLGYDIETVAHRENWLKRYREQWLMHNKESELERVEQMLQYTSKEGK